MLWIVDENTASVYSCFLIVLCCACLCYQNAFQTLGFAMSMQYNAIAYHTVTDRRLAISNGQRCLLRCLHHRSSDSRNRIGWRGQKSLLSPQLDQRLHRLDLLVANQAVQAPDVDEVDEARVKLLVGIDVPERLQPVSVVDMCVAAHHLPVDALDVALKILRESRRFAQPITPRQLREWRVDGSWWQSLGSRVSLCCRARGVGGGVEV